MTRLEKDLASVEAMYDRMETLLGGPEPPLRTVTGVSGWSAAEQLHHVLLANRWALSTIVAMVRGHGNFPEEGRLNVMGVLLLGLGRIPRGRGKAPAAARPKADTPISDLVVHLRKQRGYLATIREHASFVVSSRTRFQHGYFGAFRATDGIRFVRVHSDHHLRIVDEILERATS